MDEINCERTYEKTIGSDIQIRDQTEYSFYNDYPLTWMVFKSLVSTAKIRQSDVYQKSGSDVLTFDRFYSGMLTREQCSIPETKRKISQIDRLANLANKIKNSSIVLDQKIEKLERIITSAFCILDDNPTLQCYNRSDTVEVAGMR